MATVNDGESSLKIDVVVCTHCIHDEEPLYMSIEPLSYNSLGEEHKGQQISNEESAIQEKLKHLGYL